MKEMLKMMNLREWVFHLTWLVTYACFFFMQSLFQSVYLCAYVFQKSNLGLILLFIFSFNLRYVMTVL